MKETHEGWTVILRGHRGPFVSYGNSGLGVAFFHRYRDACVWKRELAAHGVTGCTVQRATVTIETPAPAGWEGE